MTILQRFKAGEDIRNKLSKRSKNNSLAYHFIIVLISILISTFIYYLIVKSLNLNFENPKTTTISWFTLNNYPRQQDYFYFMTSFVFITSLSCILWFLCIWLKKSK